jgi:hypothetical protein
VIALVLVVALLGVAVVVVAVRTALDDGPMRAVVTVAAVTLTALLVVGALGTGLPGSGSSEEEAADPAPTTTAPARATPLLDVDVELAARAPDQLPAIAPVLGALADGDSVVIAASGLDELTRATVHQCPAGAAVPAECREGLSVTVSEHQRLTVLVDLVERFGIGSSSVDCTVEDCSVVIFGSERLELRTVFGREAPPPVEVSAEPAALPPGSDVTARATGLPPRAEVTFSVCRPDGNGGADCGASSRVQSTADGTALAELEVSAGRCGRGEVCAVAVEAGDSGALAYRHLHLIGRGGASYDDDRVALGLLAAAVLLGIALLVLRRTDWTPVEGDPFAGVVLPEDPFAEGPGG